MDDTYFDPGIAEQYGPEDGYLDAEEESAIEMLAPGGEPTPQSALDAALATGPIMAGDWWDTPLQLVEPAFLQVPGGKALIYPGKSHSIVGEAGKGKSMLAQHLCVEEARAGRNSLFIDLEKGFDNFRERVRALGATREAARGLGYWRLTRGLTPRAVERIVEFTQRWGVQVVVIDSVGRALTRAGLEENSNTDVRLWYDGVVEPLMRAGVTPVLIDHFKKPGESGAPHGRFAKGAGAKLDVIDGAAYGVQTISPFSKDKQGKMKVVCQKDNNGTHAEGEVVAVVSVTPSPDGHIAFEMGTQQVSHTPTGEVRRTWYMEEVSRYLEKQDGPVSKDNVRAALGRNKGYVTQAIDTLVAEGHLTEVPGKRNSKQLTSVKPYRQDEDDKAAASDPF